MSARTPFFAPARPSFTADPNNPLHSQSAEIVQANSNKGIAPTTFAAPGLAAERHVQTSGLSGIRKKRSSLDGATLGSMAMGGASMMRPGTADPHGRSHRAHRMPPPNGQIPIMAPSPQNMAKMLPALLSSGQQAGSLAPSGSNLSSKILTALDAAEKQNSAIGGRDIHESLKFRPSNPNGPQRVLIEPEPSQYHAYRAKVQEEEAALSGHEFTEDGKVRRASFHQGLKRPREEEDDGDDENLSLEPQGKRFRAEEQVLVEEKITRSRTFSPAAERTSSGLSYTSVSYDRRQSSEMPDRHQSHRTSSVRQPSVQQESPLQDMQHQHRHETKIEEEKSQPEPRPLEKLLGRNSDTFIQERSEIYDALVKKWSECTMSEWIAGSNEISASFGKSVDFVKKYMDEKLKVYSNLDVSIKSQENVLRERSRILESAQVRLIKESGNALG